MLTSAFAWFVGNTQIIRFGTIQAQVGIGRYHRSAWGEASRFLPPPGFQVFAERGAAWVEWSTAPDNHTAQRLYDSLTEEKSTWLSYELEA